MALLWGKGKPHLTFDSSLQLSAMLNPSTVSSFASLHWPSQQPNLLNSLHISCSLSTINAVLHPLNVSFCEVRTAGEPIFPTTPAYKQSSFLRPFLHCPEDMDDQPILDILNQTQPKHVWSKADRELLAVAQKLFDVSNKELTILFNHLSRDTLSGEGFTEGLKVTAIAAQVSDLKRTGRGQDFREIQSMAPTAVRNRFDDLATTIQEAARNLGLRLRSYADQSLSGHVSPSKRPTARTDDWPSDDEEDKHSLAKKQRIIRTPSPNVSPANTGCDIDDTTTPTTNTTLVTPASLVTSRFVDSCSPGSYRPRSDSPENDHQFLSDEHFPATSGKIPPLLRINHDNSGRLASSRPRLLFRAYNPKHGLVARRFLDRSTTIPSPPMFFTKEFRNMARSHLYEDKTFMSPFLSWTESPKRALQLIQTSEVPLSMAILDYNTLEEDLSHRFGRNAGPWLVPAICQRFNFTDLRRIHDGKLRTPRRLVGVTLAPERYCSPSKVLRAGLNFSSS